MQRVYIRTNNKQILGAHIAKFSILKNLKEPDSVEVVFANVDEMPAFQKFVGKKFRRYGELLTYNKEDLQSFTLAVFAVPELNGYQGRAVVIDPDVFALSDINELFNTNLCEHSLAARAKRGGHDTSVVLLDCGKLSHWKIQNILDDLAMQKVNYGDWMSLKNDSVLTLDPVWNSWDELNGNTKLLHTTNRLTQPWKTGLRIDFHRNQMGKLFGIISKRWVYELIGKLPRRYQPHPDKNIERFFIHLVRDALADGAVGRDLIEEEIVKEHIRPDLLKLVEGVPS